MNKTVARMERSARKAKQEEPEFIGGGIIELTNPISHHFPTFIFGNSTMCRRVVEQGEGLGKTLAICGAGPSLAETADEYLPQVDHVWGCNSALTYLYERGHKVTHGFTVDQMPQMVEEWASAPDVVYLLASTCHPHLTEYLQGRGRSCHFFHNFVGIPRAPVELVAGWETASDRSGGQMALTMMLSFEDWMYAALFEPTVRTGSGLNAVTRAIDLACYMGYREIYVLGADCALRPKQPRPSGDIGTPEYHQWLTETQMHADGGNALRSGATHVTLSGKIDGRWWTSKPDMLITAVWLVRMAREIPYLHLVGDTLPNALRHKSDEFLLRMPHLTGADGKPVEFDFSLQRGYSSLV